MDGPLDGVRIIELGTNLAGPFAGKLLGEMGAEVIKIEHPEFGSPIRQRKLAYDPPDINEFTYRFLNYNTSKKSLTLDLKSGEGIELFEALVKSSDVVLENMRKGSLDRLGADWETLKSWNPNLLYCSIKGFGEGPYSEMAAFDFLIQGFSGVATQVGDGPDPNKFNIYIIDLMTGLYTAWSISMGLFSRVQTGTGQRIDITMLDVATSIMNHQLAEYTGGTHSESYTPTYTSNFEPQGYFTTADGYLGLLMPDDHYWAAFCEGIDRQEWANPSHKYSTNETRIANSTNLKKDIESVLTQRTTEEWMEVFEMAENDILAAPVNEIGELVDHPQIRAQNAIIEREHPEMGTYFMANIVPKFEQTPGEISDIGRSGCNSEEILRELGYMEEEIAVLRERNVI